MTDVKSFLTLASDYLFQHRGQNCDNFGELDAKNQQRKIRLVTENKNSNRLFSNLDWVRLVAWLGLEPQNEFVQSLLKSPPKP
jgi:hypothetical protein